MKKKDIFNISIGIGIVLLIIYIISSVGLENFSNPTKLKEYILSFGYMAFFVCFILQVLQVIIAPIPGNVTGIVCGSLFGILFGSLISLSAIVLGSFIAFYLGRKYSKAVALKFMKEETYEKYSKVISSKNGKMTLFFMYLLPIFPDDILCILAGSSNITMKQFLLMVLIGRTPGTIASAAIGAGVVDENYSLAIIIVIIYAVIIGVTYIFKDKIIDVQDSNIKQ